MWGMRVGWGVGDGLFLFLRELEKRVPLPSHPSPRTTYSPNTAMTTHPYLPRCITSPVRNRVWLGYGSQGMRVQSKGEARIAPSTSPLGRLRWMSVFLYGLHFYVVTDYRLASLGREGRLLL